MRIAFQVHVRIRSVLPMVVAFVAAAAGRSAGPPVTVSVDARQRTGANDRFWASAVFHPTEYLDRDWGRQQLALWHEGGVALNFIRIYNQPEDAVYVKADGTPGYRWDHFDRRADLIVAQGCRLFVAFYSMPPAIAANPEIFRKRPFLDGKKIYIGPPRDYRLWQEACADFTRHVVARYGAERVARWRFSCWNEPDLSSYWTKGDLVAYRRLYDHFAAGVKSVFPRVPIGGPVLSGTRTFQHPEALREFLQHVTSGTNHATGATGSPLDFIPVHTYGGQGGGGGPTSKFPSVDYMMEQQRRLAAVRDEFPALRNVPIVVDEWGVTSGGTTGMQRQPLAEVRNTSYAAAFLTTLVARQLEWRWREEPRVEDLFLCLSGYEVERRRDFEGYRTVQTLHGFDKPVLNGYRALARLGGEFVACRVEPTSAAVTAVAARDGSRRIGIVVTHFRSDRPDNGAPDLRLALKVNTGWPAGSHLELRHWRIDASHSNAYTVFTHLGRPENPTTAQIAEIKQQMGLGELQPAEPKVIEGPIGLSFDLPCNGVSLVELERRD